MLEGHPQRVGLPSAEEMRKAEEPEKVFEVDVAEKYALGMSLLAARETGAHLLRMNWSLWEAPSGAVFIAGALILAGLRDTCQARGPAGDHRGEDELTRRNEGTGLGLALVRGLAERMGADVPASNAPDGGFEGQVLFSAPDEAGTFRANFRSDQVAAPIVTHGCSYS